MAAVLVPNGGSGRAGLWEAATLAVVSEALRRASELAALTVANLDLAEQTITVQPGKTDQEGLA